MAEAKRYVQQAGGFNEGIRYVQKRAAKIVHEIVGQRHVGQVLNGFTTAGAGIVFEQGDELRRCDSSSRRSCQCPIRR